MDLTEAEDIKKMWQEYTEEKKKNTQKNCTKKDLICISLIISDDEHLFMKCSLSISYFLEIVFLYFFALFT